MRNRKGMSPLIATVLLIAFAVALGAMIMNWSSDVEQQPREDSSSGDPCAKVSMELSEVFDKRIFCYDEDQGSIRFNVVNTGSTSIQGVQVRTVDADLKQVKEDIPGSRLPVGETFEHEMPFDKSGKVHVQLVPYVRSAGESHYCLQERIIQDVLPACSAE